MRRNQVVKYGCETKFTCGTLELEGTHVRFVNLQLGLEEEGCFNSMDQGMQFKMFCQREVNSAGPEPFVKPGDSGSLVYMLQNNNEQDLVCIGMVIGQSSHGSCIITPIADVLRSLNLPLKLKEFRSGVNQNIEGASLSSNSVNSSSELLSFLLDFRRTTEATLQDLKSSTETQIREIKTDIRNMEVRFMSLENRMHDRLDADENQNVNVLDDENQYVNVVTNRGKSSGRQFYSEDL